MCAVYCIPVNLIFVHVFVTKDRYLEIMSKNVVLWMNT